jgi:hypothetical protein
MLSNLLVGRDIRLSGPNRVYSRCKLIDHRAVYASFAAGTILRGTIVHY